MESQGLLLALVLLAASLGELCSGASLSRHKEIAAATGGGFFHWTDVKSAVNANPFLRTLDEALEATGLDKPLSDKNLVATVFAPTDEAFEALLRRLDLSRDQLFRNKALLTKVLRYHVVPGSALRGDDFQDRQQVATMLRGQRITVHVQDFFVFKRITLEPSDRHSPKASVLFPNIEGGKAIVHVVDEVLMPDLPSLSSESSQADSLATDEQS